MRLLLALLLLLPTLAHAMDARALLAVIGRPYDPCAVIGGYATCINALPSISSSGTTDTGTATFTGTGDITVSASCTGGNGAGAIYLSVNDADVDSLYCGYGTVVSDTLSYSVDGAYSVRVYGGSSGTGTFSANTFRLPTSPLTDWTSKPPAGTALRTDGHWSVNGLVGAYPFNEGSGTTVANLVTGATSTIGAGVTWSSGKLAFSGSDYSYIPLGLTVPSGAMSIVAGFATASRSNNNIALFSGDSLNTALVIPSSSSDNRPLFKMGASNGRYFVPPADITSVSHWAVTLPGSAQSDISSAALYADGSALSVYSTTSSGGQSPRTTLQLGKVNATYSAQGTADYYYVYNRALSATEIASLSANPYQIFAQH